MYSTNPSLYKWQAGHGKGRLLGKDDSCESLWSSTYELFSYGTHFIIYRCMYHFLGKKGENKKGFLRDYLELRPHNKEFSIMGIGLFLSSSGIPCCIVVGVMHTIKVLRQVPSSWRDTNGDTVMVLGVTLSCQGNVLLLLYKLPGECDVVTL